jgi:type I restriction enzyme S subunit
MSGEFSRLTMGSTHQTIYMPDVRSFSTALPSLDEQKEIIAFLDRETARIDGLIAKKRRLIELLREKRQAVISHAVTKGLDPNAPMKESGVEWLGEVPAHWDLLRAKVLFAEADQRSTTGDEELLTVSHISGVTRRSEKEVNMFMAESLEGYKKCRAGDLVINTMWAWMGALGFAWEDGLVSPSYNVYRARLKQPVLPKFFDLLLRTPIFVAEATRRSKGVWTSRMRLYPEAFLDTRVAIPPVPEQHAIVAELKRMFGRYERTIEAAEQAISKLEEHRAALIAAAVTGKIDVRAYPADAVEAAD